MVGVKMSSAYHKSGAAADLNLYNSTMNYCNARVCYYETAAVEYTSARGAPFVYTPVYTTVHRLPSLHNLNK